MPGNYSNFDRPKILGRKDIDWKYLSKPERILIKDKAIDPVHQWYWYLGKLGLSNSLKSWQNADIREFGNPFIYNKRQLGLFLALDPEQREDLHFCQGYLNTLDLVGQDFKALDKLSSLPLGSLMPGKSLFKDFSKAEKAEAKGLCLRDSRYVPLIKNLKLLKEELGGRLPVSFEEAQRLAKAFRYQGIISPAVAKACAEVGISQGEFQKVQKFYLRELEKGRPTHEGLPIEASVEMEGYKMRFLPRGDIRGLLLGEYTNCCQSLHSAGGTCAMSGFTDPDKGFVIVEKDCVIIAQSWVWKSKNNSLIFDSVESKGLEEERLNKVANLYLAFSRHINDGCGLINGVYIGKTGYGITKKIRKLLWVDDKTHNKKPLNYNGYMDGKEQYRIL